MVIDMHAAGRRGPAAADVTGNSEFNEVFFNDVFVPDDDVVGAVNAGWTVARATLGNESGQHRRRRAASSMPAEMVIAPARRPPGAAGRRGRPGRPLHLAYGGAWPC